MSVPRVLTRARAVMLHTFTTTAVVYRRVETSDSAGGFVVTFPEAQSVEYPCSFTLYPVRPMERETFERIQAIAQWMFVFAWDADVRNTDRIVCEGRTFEVIDAGVSSVNISRKAICLEIK